MAQIDIEEKKTIYDVKYTYHSNRKCQNYDAQIEAQEESDGTVSLTPGGAGSSFEFYHSDPDRVIAVAQMMIAFAQMVKDKNNKPIDTNANA